MTLLSRLIRGLVILLSLLLLSCSSSYFHQVELFPGYILFKANSAQYTIGRPDGYVILGPTIKAMAVRGPYIIGEIEPSPHFTNWESRKGYFILDSRTGRRRNGLSLAKWNAELTAAGITAPPLRPPLLSHYR